MASGTKTPRPRVTIGSTGNRAVFGCATTRNNGRYNGNGREWETPPEVFGPLHTEFAFTLDPCATPQNAKCARYFYRGGQRVGAIMGWGARVHESALWARNLRVDEESARGCHARHVSGGATSSINRLSVVAR